jgi:hypothetical protein
MGCRFSGKLTKRTPGVKILPSYNFYSAASLKSLTGTAADAMLEMDLEEAPGMKRHRRPAACRVTQTLVDSGHGFTPTWEIECAT